MRLHQHAIASAVISGGLFGFTKSWEIAIASFLVGFLIDLDHLLDYWIQHPFKTDVVHFFKTCEEFKLKRVFIFLHSIELLIILGIAVYFTRSQILIGISIGIAQHFIFDHLFNGIYPFTYFLTYRFANSFVNSKIFVIPEKKVINTESSNG